MIIKLGLAIFIWLGILTLQVVLMGIARFFQHTSGKRTLYPLYLVTLTLTLIGAGRYIIRIPQASKYPDFVGDPVANILLFVAGLLLFGLGNFLYERMMGESTE